MDELEYQYHKKVMKYSDDLDFVIRNSLKELIQIYNEHFLIFDKKLNYSYYEQYEKLIKKSKKQISNN